MKKVLGFIIAISMATGLYAQAPGKMSFQSVIRNSAGQLIANNPVSMRISILQGTATGSIVYLETHAKFTNENGLVSLEVGGGTVGIGTFSTINWANGPYFLKTETDPAGGTNYTISGTSQLLSVPYALYAEKSGNSASDWLTNSNGIYYNAGRVGVGKVPHTNVPISVLQANSGVGEAVFEGLSDDVWHAAITLKNNPTNMRYSFVIPGPTNTNLSPGSFGIFNHENLKWVFVSNRTTNNIGIGSPGINAAIPKSTLHVFTGDVNIEQVGKGIIMRSPNGQCWRVTVDNTGNLVSTSITCP
jgi:hypothetical protein